MLEQEQRKPRTVVIHLLISKYVGSAGDSVVKSLLHCPRLTTPDDFISLEVSTIKPSAYTVPSDVNLIVNNHKNIILFLFTFTESDAHLG